jgi:hypothetical protein
VEAEGDPVEDAVVGEAGELLLDQVGPGTASWATTAGAARLKMRAATRVGKVRRVSGDSGDMDSLRMLKDFGFRPNDTPCRRWSPVCAAGYRGVAAARVGLSVRGDGAG